MLLIPCPWCGARAESEFSYGGEAGISRPVETEKLNDAEWAEYVFMRTNPRGDYRELWHHIQGCRRWFGVERNTVTYKISGSYTLSTAQQNKRP
jgi:sarcosine oxidase subunit delta